MKAADGSLHAEAATAAEDAAPEAHDRPVPPDFANLSASEVVAIVREELAKHDGLRDVVVDWAVEQVALSGEVSSDELADVARQIVADRLGLRVEDRIRVTPVIRELAPAAPESNPEELSFRPDASSDERPEAGESGEPFTPPDQPPPEPRKE